MMSTIAAAHLPSCWYIHNHLNVHHHAQQKRKLTPLSLANADSQIPIRNIYGTSLPQTHNCSKGKESNNRARYNSNSNQNHKHPFFRQYFPVIDTKYSNNQNPKTRKHNRHQVDEQRQFKANKESRVLFTDMWWVDMKAAFGQRINLEGILCTTMVILKDPKLALPHISVPDIRYVDWAELRRKGFKGVVFDKDNTITAPYSLMPWPPLESSLEHCKSEFGPDIAVFSNSAGNYSMDHFKIVNFMVVVVAHTMVFCCFIGVLNQDFMSMTMMVQKLPCLRVQLELKSSDIVSVAFLFRALIL